MTAFDQLTSYNIKPVMQLISKCVSVDIGMVW